MKMNYYLGGTSNRNELAKTLARSLFPDIPDEELFFIVKANKNAFKDYAGQPVCIWENRAAGFPYEIGGVADMLVVFDTKYRAGEHNGIPLNVVNIVTGMLHPNLFLTAIAGPKAKRPTATISHCFPVVAKVRKDYYETFVNTEYTNDGTPNNYQRVSTVRFTPNKG